MGWTCSNHFFSLVKRTQFCSRGKVPSPKGSSPFARNGSGMKSEMKEKLTRVSGNILSLIREDGRVSFLCPPEKERASPKAYFVPCTARYKRLAATI